MAVGRSTADVVRCAGGWLFDCCLAGQDVMVLAPEAGDERSLRILGAHAGDLEAALSSRDRGPRPHVLAVDTGLYETDARVRKLVRLSLEQGLTEVRFWGGERQSAETGAVEHRLSMAALAFKTQALAAAAAPTGLLDTTEVFLSGELVPEPPAPDLVPVA
ncbi:hypothetical protein FPZ12_042250 [Amycolatopsis acidicola]|uniref:Uncharacterized protein n=1 Tax=Amycolatopsis acidicola TaxID=2596893 RepID=A0A5N0UKU9_9PSEU|nr:hypothetical protein FPZ12_042250 [Amycolatopsis acidicola]